LAGGSYTCTFAKLVTGTEQLSHTNEVTATAKDKDDNQVQDDDPATVTFDEKPLIDVTKTADPSEVEGTNGLVNFTVRVDNTGPVAVTLTSLDDDKFGDLTAIAGSSCLLEQTLDVGGFYTCIFQATLTGNESLAHTNVVTATAFDKDENQVTDKDDATVTFDEKPAITVNKTANPTEVDGTSGVVQFTVDVQNTGPVTVLLTSLQDTVFGNLTSAAGTTCAVPQELDLNEVYSCTFTGSVTGSEATPHHNTVTATGEDKDKNPVSASDEETVFFDEKPLIEVIKTADPVVVSEPGGLVTFSVVVKNKSHQTLRLTEINDELLVDSTATSGDIAGNTCVASEGAIAVLAPMGQEGDSHTCSFKRTVGGDETQLHHNEVTATAMDNEQNQVSAKDDATVTISDASAIDITLTPECIQDAPWLTYTVTPTNINPAPNPVTIRWIDVDNDQVLYEQAGLPLSGKVLWREAQVDGTGKGIAWPGWRQLENGQWIDDGSNLRPQVKVELQVNPTASEVVTYPPAEPTCNAAPRATIGDLVWNDANENGVQDAGELGVAGVTVNLLDAQGNLLATTQTDDAGKYKFENLLPGDYLVEFVKPETAGGFTTPDQGGDDAKDSDADPATGRTPLFSLPAGALKNDLDGGLRFPVVPAATTFIGDKVWLDGNQNGLQDGDEPGAGGVTVKLFRQSGELVATTTTASDGSYLFQNLPLDTSYYVEFELPAGYRFTQPNVQADGQDGEDSDAVAPLVAVTISGAEGKPQLGKPYVYTIGYQVNSASQAASNVQLAVTVPAGTVADLAASSAGWTCSATPAAAGSTCQLAIGEMVASAQGNATFVVVLDADDATVPSSIELAASVTYQTAGLSHVVTPQVEGDRTVDAGLVQGEVRQSATLATQREPGTTPTGLDEQDQPAGPKQKIFLPTVSR
jgi:hypothetical protein